MRLTRFGATGLVVSEVGLGTRAFGETIDEQGCQQIVNRYEDIGGNLIDTAVTYADGRSEEILGRLLAGTRRERFVLSTKFGVRRDPSDANSAGASRRNLSRSLDESLRRLRTDYVDLLWLHAWHTGLAVDEFLRSARDEVARGRVLNIGVSNAPAWWIAHVHTRAQERGWEPLAGIQVEYSLGCREAEHELFPMAAELGLATVAWSPLGRGRLLRPSDGRQPMTDDDGQKPQVSGLLSEVARSAGLSMAGTAMGWVISKGVIPLAGARRPSHIDELADVVARRLKPEQAKLLDNAMATEAPALGRFLDQVRDRVDPALRAPATTRPTSGSETADGA